MSLLLKALQKAGEDRPGASGQESFGPGRPELTLQPLPTAPATARKPAYAEASPMQAASMLAAGGRRPSIVDYARERPLVVLAAAATLFLAAYGCYVYLQLAPGPGSFVPRGSVAPQPGPIAAVLDAAPRPALAAPARYAPSPTAPMQLPAAPADLASSTPQIATKAGPPSAGVTSHAAPVSDEPARSPRMMESADQAGSSNRHSTHAAGEAQGDDESASSAPTIKPRTRSRPNSAQGETIDISRETTLAEVSPGLGAAYQALQSGDYADAESRYQKLLQDDPKNPDVLLGLAAIAAQKNKPEAASEYYFRILEADPKNALAQAGLIAIGGQADRQNAETRLKQLIAREPSGFLYFVLGNLYADQSQWAAAQAAYFQAHHMQPDHADYAFNLAIGLEHLSQRKLAADYYRRALALVALGGNASFSQAMVEQHIAELAAGGE